MYVGARVAFLCATVAACGQEPAAPISAQRTMDRACSAGSNISLASAQSTVVDCSNGGTTATLAAGGASYLVVAQLATGSAAPGLVAYTLSTDAGAAATSAASHSAAPVTPAPAPPLDRQLAFDLRLRERERRAAQSPAFASAALRAPAFELGVSSAVAPVTGSVRDFRVLSNYASATDSWRTVAARLEYAGANLLLYVDTLTPHAGFSAAALQQYGQYFDQTLYPMDAGAFGQPADVDGNGRVIMLMSPVVNAGTPAASCYTQGYVAGFFNGQDFNGASDPNSNRGEIFYSIVADPQGSYGCAHSVADVSSGEPAVFLHELQHLISYSQHVVVHGGKPAAGWMDEGLSLVAEELGSRYYEARCPAPACRSTPGQLFPDSSAGFVRNFLLTSYAFASHPDSNSLTLHDDGDFGLAWRGGEWAFMRWLGDHMPDGFYRSLESGSADGIAAIEAAAGGQNFATLFANFGLALYTDSLPGLPRNTAPLADRFASRNPRALWALVVSPYAWSAQPSSAFPIPVHAVASSATPVELAPGGMAYWRLDTAPGATVARLRFTALDGSALDPALRPQLAIFRLPPGQ